MKNVIFFFKSLLIIVFFNNDSIAEDCNPDFIGIWEGTEYCWGRVGGVPGYMYLHVRKAERVNGILHYETNIEDPLASIAMVLSEWNNNHGGQYSNLGCGNQGLCHSCRTTFTKAGLNTGHG